jgi:hypothetical protein
MELRPTWIAVAIVTCVIFGSTVNKCLTCGPGAKAEAKPRVVREGRPFVGAKGRGEEGEMLAFEPRPRQPAPEPPAEQPKPAGLEDHADLTFDKLASYKYEVRERVEGAAPLEQIPASVKELDGKKFAIKGFMLPYRNDGENVIEFILLRNQGLCCFGTVPRMNEWIHVKMAPRTGAPYSIDIPITVFGTLAVGEEYEKNVLMSLYRMESTFVLVPPVYR